MCAQLFDGPSRIRGLATKQLRGTVAQRGLVLSKLEIVFRVISDEKVFNTLGGHPIGESRQGLLELALPMGLSGRYAKQVSREFLVARFSPAAQIIVPGAPSVSMVCRGA
jgi:hypothetical protein